MDPLEKKYIFDRETRLREAFTQNNFGAAADIFAGQPVADPQAALRKSAAAAWMRTRSGRKEIDPTTPLWQGQKEGLAQGYFKVAEPKGISDDAIFDLIKADYQARQDVAELSFNAWAQGMQPTQMFNEWAAKGTDNPAKGRWGDYQQELNKTYSKLYAENEQYREMIDRNAAKVVAGNTAGFKEFADELMTVPENKQRLIIRAMAAKAAQNPEEQRAWYAKLGEGMGRMAESLVGAAESGFADAAAAVAMAELATGGADAVGLIPDVEAGRQENRDYYSLVNMIRKTADEKIDPVTMENWLGSSVLEVSRMTPMIGASLVPIAGQATLVSWFRDDVSSSLMLENEGISRESADAIANIAAVPLAATETVSSLVPLGKLPFLSKFLKQGVSTWTRAAARGAAFTATGVVVENLEEAAQQIIPNYVQNFFAALREDVDYVNFAEQERQLMKLPGQVTGPALILSLIGGGVTSVSAVRNGRALASDSDLMIATGISPEVAQQINAAAQTGNWQQVDQLFTGAFNKDKGGYDGASDEQRQQAAQAFIAKQTQAQAAEKTLEMTGALAVFGRSGDQWQILPSDGSAPVSFGTFEQANAARWQDAKMKNIRLDGITRQAIEQADRMLQDGQQNAYEFSAEEMTKELAVQRGLVTEEQAGKREKQAAALDEGKAEDDLYRASMNEAAAQGDTDPVTVILGMSSLEMREGVQTGVIRLFKGANFTDLIEEISETSLKRYLQSGQAQQQQMVSKLRDVERRLQAMEQADGQAPSLLFRTSNDAELTSEDVIEAFSHLAKSYYLNAAEKGIGWRKQDKNLPRYLRRLRASIEQTGFYNWIKTLGSKLRSIFKRAAQLEKLRTEGQLDADLETLIRRSVGLESQAQFEQDTVKEAQALAKEAVGTTMSAGQAPQAGTLEERLAAMFDPFQKSPELRRKIGVLAQERVTKIARQLGEVLGSTAKTQEKLAELDTKYSEELAAAKADYDAEVATLRDERDLEMNGARVEGKSKEEVQKINTEYTRKIGQRQREWERQKGEIETRQANERAAINKGLAGLSAEGVVQALRTLNAAVSALPAEVRAKILPGGAVKIARLKTTEQRIAAIEQIVQRADVELEKWLRKETTALVEKTFERYRPERKAGEKPKGKLDPDSQELVDLAEAAMDMSPEQAIEQLAAIDAALANPEITPEQEVLQDRKRVMIELFSDWKNADAGRMDAALDALEETASEGWAKWKLKQIIKAEKRQEIRDNLRADTGKKGLAGERDQMRKEGAKVVGKSLAALLNLSSFAEVLKYTFGAKSKTALELTNEERAASNQYEDTIQSVADQVQDFFSTLAGGVLKGEQMRFDMAQPKLTVGKGENQRMLSELQGVQALLMWQQEDGKRHMEGPRDESNQPIPGKWSYDQAWIDELTAKLPPRALRTKAFLESLYAAEYEPLNALYRERHGVNLPRHKMYAPLTVAPQQAKAGEMVDPVSGAAISGSILTPGALRSRNRIAVAEPRFDDALAIFIAHNKQMEHWKAYYDFAVQAQAVFGNRDVMNSVEAAAGKEAVKMLRQRVEAFAQGGIRDAGAGLFMTQGFQRAASRAAVVGLLGRVSTLLVQSTQLAAASVQMPTGSYMLRLSKLLTGNLSWGDAVNSEFIQRRIKTAPPIVQQAVAELGRASRPNQITRAVRNLGNLLSGADGLFTGGTYAILLDWNRTQGAKLGLEGAELEAFAHSEAARLTEEVAQPVRLANRSMMELTMTSPWTKVGWAYSSEARQKIALWAWSLTQARQNPARFAKATFLTFIVGGLMSQVIKNLWREMKGDDDESKWSAERLAKATLAGPLHGIPGISEMNGEPGLFSAAIWAKPAAKRLIDAALDERDYESTADVVRDVSTIIGAAGYANDTLSGIAALSNAGVDFAQLLEEGFKEE